MQVRLEMTKKWVSSEIIKLRPKLDASILVTLLSFIYSKHVILIQFTTPLIDVTDNCHARCVAWKNNSLCWEYVKRNKIISL